MLISRRLQVHVLTVFVGFFTLTTLSLHPAHAVDPEPSRAVPVVIDCDRGDRPADVLARNRTADAFEIRGSCELAETLRLERDDVALRGAPGASLSGAGLVVHGASGVSLENLAVRRVLGTAIKITGGAEAHLSGLLVEQAEVGVMFVASSGEMVEITVRDQQLAGIWSRASHVVLGGRIDVSNSGVAGVVATESGVLTVTDPQTHLETTGSFFGVLLQESGSLVFEQGTLAARRNAGDGFRLYGRGFMVQTDGLLIAEENGGFGLSAAQSADWIISLTTKFRTASRLVGNAAGGALVVGGSTATLFGAEIHDNGNFGVLVDAAAIVPLRDTKIRDNELAGILISFGSVVSFFERNTIDDAVICQEPILVRGTLGCDAGASTTMSPEVLGKVEHAVRAAMRAPQLRLPR